MLCFSELLFHEIADVGEDFQLVRLHQKFVAGTGVEFDPDVPHPGVLQALHGPLDARAPLAHGVRISGEEEHRQVLRHPVEEGRVVQAEDAAEHAVVGVEGEGTTSTSRMLLSFVVVNW